MPAVLVTDPIHQAGLNILTQRSDVVIDYCPDRVSEEELIQRVANADGRDAGLRRAQSSRLA